jgi:hypothetical protein
MTHLLLACPRRVDAIKAERTDNRLRHQRAFLAEHPWSQPTESTEAPRPIRRVPTGVARARQPASGITVLLRYHAPIGSHEFCTQLLEQTSVMLTPNAAFDIEHTVRIGFADDTQALRTGIELAGKAADYRHVHRPHLPAASQRRQRRRQGHG